MISRTWRVAALPFLSILSAGALAGGPLIVQDDGSPFVWSTSTAVEYRTDNGALSATVGESVAQGRVADMFQAWDAVLSASISFTRAGFIEPVGAFGGGDVNTIQEFNAVEGDCGNGNQSPIIYDANGQIFVDLGIDETMVIGFAGPCAIDFAQGLIVSGEAVMNGLFQDGNANPVQDLTTTEYDATFIHEFGHFAGLDHSQINVDCGFMNCGADALAGLPTMFPFLVSDTQAELSIDDKAWISKLYPAAGGSGFNATHGHITGTVLFSDGESHAQLVNVVARRVDNPVTGGVDESLTTAASNVSGYRFRLFLGNPINAASDDFGSVDPAVIGFYEIPLPPGSYMLEVESIDPAFTEGSSVGGPVRIDMPGTAPAPLGPINVAAGVTSSGNDIVLIGTAPRFDQFEGP